VVDFYRVFDVAIGDVLYVLCRRYGTGTPLVVYDNIIFYLNRFTYGGSWLFYFKFTSNSKWNRNWVAGLL